MLRSRCVCRAEVVVEVCLSGLAGELSPCRKFENGMSGHTVPADFSGHMLDLDEDEDLEVFSKVKTNMAKTSDSQFQTVPAVVATWVSPRH